MAASNSTALAEILGIPSSSSSAYPSAVASPAPVVSDPALALPSTTTHTPTAIEAQDSLQKLMTSSQSVADYFKAKLGAKAHGERQAPRPTLATVGAATNAPPASARDEDGDGRAGLGLGSGLPRGPPQDSWDDELVRRGIGASSSSRSVTMFMPGQPTIEAREEITATAGVELAVTHDAADHDGGRRKSEKRRAKEERRREKEERRRRRAEAGRVTVDAPVDGAHAAGAKKKHCEPGASHDRSEDSHHSGAGGGDIVATKKGKKRDKGKKSAKHCCGE